MRVFTLLVTVATAAWPFSKPAWPSSKPAWADRKLPVAFEPNRGQAAAPVEYLAAARGYTLSLRSGNAELVGHGSRISASLTGGLKSRAEAEAPLPGVVHYLLGPDPSAWHTGIPTYARVRYRQVYRGIDVLYYGQDGRLEYDFVVAPGADPRQIRIAWRGARGLHLDSAGDLVLETAAGAIRQQHPAIYQDVAGLRREVKGGYVLRGNTVRFQVAQYDRGLPLIIDPAITWAAYSGATVLDEARAVTSDASGNVYITGSALATRGDTDCFVVKLDPTGKQVWRVLVGAQDGDDDGYAIGLDGSGNVYVAGATASDLFPTVNATQTLSGQGTDGFIAKLDPTGSNYVYSNYLGGSSDEIVFSLAVDANSNLYVGGATLSVDFPVTRTGAQRVNGGGIGGFIGQFDSTGKLIYCSYLGGGGDDFVLGIGLDGAGNMYVTGSTASTDFPATASAFQPKIGGGTDAYVAKLAPGGAITWATYVGGTGDDEANGIAVDAAGAAYITGGTASTNFPTASPYQGANAGGARDIFVSKLSPDGAKLAYSTYLGGTGDELGNGIAVDRGGNAYIGGTSNSTNFPSISAFQGALKGGADGVVAELSAAGDTLVFSSFLGGTGNDFVESVAVNCVSGLVVAGTSGSNNFPATVGTAVLNYAAGDTTGFVAQVAAGAASTTVAAGGVVNAATSSSAPVSPGSLISIYGTLLGSGVAGASSTPLATSLGGATVTINGTPAPLVYVSPGQINAQLPYEIPAGTASATVTAGCGTSAAVPFQVVPAAPYLLLGADGSALVQHQDFTFNAQNNPAKTGSVIVVYLIGIGPLDNAVATGAAAPADKLSSATLPVKVTIGNSDTAVKFLGLTPGFVGLAQANLVVPVLSPGKYPIVITVNGVDSNAATMYVQ
jgi:uncharacterized protein (TIGR03437 family)